MDMEVHCKKLIQTSRIEIILKASKIRQDDINSSPELSDGPLPVMCHKNCLLRYVYSLPTLQNLSKWLPSDKTFDDDSGPKRLRSSTGGMSCNLQKHCLFCLDITECILPDEYDPKVPQYYFHRNIHRANKSDDKCEVDRTFTQLFALLVMIVQKWEIPLMLRQCTQIKEVVSPQGVSPVVWWRYTFRGHGSVYLSDQWTVRPMDCTQRAIQSIGPTVHWSDSSLVRQSTGPTDEGY